MKKWIHKIASFFNSSKEIGESIDESSPFSLVKVDGLTIFLKKQQKKIAVVKNIHFEIAPGELVGIVGESGSGKTLTAQTIGLLNQHETTGSIYFEKQNLFSKSEIEKRIIRQKKIGFVFQNPHSSLNPSMKIGNQILEAIPSKDKEFVYQLLMQVGLSDCKRVYQSYPHELSGGMCQRVVIAMAIAKKPKLLIADEPTTALDPETKIQILTLLKSETIRNNSSLLLVTHDFSVLEAICTKVIVMYAGQIVETGTLTEVLQNPKHPYTQALLAARPSLKLEKKSKLHTIPGSPISLFQETKGCSFANRCTKVTALCKEEIPSFFEKNDTSVACWNYTEK